MSVRKKTDGRGVNRGKPTKREDRHRYLVCRIRLVVMMA
jgi:hypothetical protein